MMEKTIALTLYRRPGYTMRLLSALRECDDIKNYTLVVNCDHDDRYSSDCLTVQDLVKQFSDSRIAKDVLCRINTPRLGIDENKLDLLPRAFQLSDYVIVLEDDTIPSVDALRWFEWGGCQFGPVSEVASICGYRRVLDKDASEIPVYECTIEPGFHTWGWAMWSDRYEHYYGMDGEKYRNTIAKLFGANQINGRFDWYLSERPEIQKVQPTLARIQLIGWDQAEHTPSREWFMTYQYNEVGAWDLKLPKGPKEWRLRGSI